MAPLKVHGPVRMRSIQTGITKWKEGSFEIVEKDNKVSLVVHYNVGGIPKTFQLSHNIKTVVLRPNGGKLCCLMLTLKDASFLTIDKVPSKDANEMRMYLDAVLHDRVHTAVKPSQGSGSFGGVLGSRTTQKEANRQFPYIENQQVTMSDITLMRISDSDKECMLRESLRRPGPYAAMLCKAMIPEYLMIAWRRNVSYYGGHNKAALPRNLMQRLSNYLQESFMEMSHEDFCSIPGHIDRILL